jgi:hypothetical protein
MLPGLPVRPSPLRRSRQLEHQTVFCTLCTGVEEIKWRRPRRKWCFAVPAIARRSRSGVTRLVDPIEIPIRRYAKGEVGRQPVRLALARLLRVSKEVQMSQRSILVRCCSTGSVHAGLIQRLSRTMKTIQSGS